MPATLPPKQYRFGKECRQDMMVGINLMREAVTATLGPNGRNVAIDRYMVIDITKDGVTVLGDVVADEPFAEMGCKQVREASTKTNDEAGDGTTTAIEIAWAACKYGMEKIEKGTNVIKIQNGMQKAMDCVTEELKKMAIICDKKEDAQESYVDVATISAQDEAIGKKVAEIFMESGENGVIDIERVDKPGIETEHTDGMKIHEGFMRPEFINDWSNLSFLTEDCAIVVTDREVTSNRELEFLELIAKKGLKRVVLFCDDCNGEALATFVKCARTGAFHCCVVKAPAFGPRKREILKDICAMTGATLISEENGLNLDEMQYEHIGRARQVTCRQKYTVIVSNNEWEAFNPYDGTKTSNKALVATRVEEIEATIKTMEDGYERDKVKERLANLTDGVSIVKLGGTTELERILNKRRVEDAIRAVQCAKEEGIVAGGGAALLKCVRGLDILLTTIEDHDERSGVEIVREAIQSPARRILEVASVEPESAPWYYCLTPTLRQKWTKKCQDKIVNTVINSSVRQGFDMKASDYHYTDLVLLGVVDPVKVVRVACMNGLSCAKTFLSNEVAITPIPERDPNQQRR